MMFLRRLSILLAIGMAILLPTAAGAAGSVPAWRVLVPARSAPLFYHAAGLAAGADGTLYLADDGDHRLVHLSASGSILAVWGTDGSGPLHFAGPNAAAVGPNGTIYLTDARSLLALSPAGKVLARHTGLPAGVTGLAMGASGDLYALALQNTQRNVPGYDRVIVLHLRPDGSIVAIHTITYQRSDDQYVLAASIAPTPNGAPLISVEAMRHCHSCDGSYGQIWHLAEDGSVTSRTSAPVGGGGVGVLPGGDIVLAVGSRLDLLSPDGSSTVVGNPGCGPLAFSADVRLAVASGRLYAADSQPVIYRDGSAILPPRDGILHILAGDLTPIQTVGACPLSPTIGFGQLEGMVIGRDGTLFAADEDASAVFRISPDGTLFDFPTPHPSSVAIGGSGNLFVPDLQHDSIDKYSPNGGLLGVIPNRPVEGLTVAPNGLIYALNPFGQVVVLRQPGSRGRAVVRTWELRGFTRHSSGADPTGIAIAPNGEVVVADTRHSRVQVYSSTGRWLAAWGGYGTAPGRLRRPVGVTVDRNGRIYVSDTGNGRIEVFGARGRLLRVLGRTGMAPGQFENPTGIAVGKDGSLYVADRDNDRVQVLS